MHLNYGKYAAILRRIKSPPEMCGTFVGKKKWYIDRNMYGYRPEIKIRYIDVNCELYVLYCNVPVHIMEKPALKTV